MYTWLKCVVLGTFIGFRRTFISCGASQWQQCLQFSVGRGRYRGAVTSYLHRSGGLTWRLHSPPPLPFAEPQDSRYAHLADISAEDCIYLYPARKSSSITNFVTLECHRRSETCKAHLGAWLARACRALFLSIRRSQWGNRGHRYFIFVQCLTMLRLLISWQVVVKSPLSGQLSDGGEYMTAVASSLILPGFGIFCYRWPSTSPSPPPAQGQLPLATTTSSEATITTIITSPGLSPPPSDVSTFTPI